MLKRTLTCIAVGVCRVLPNFLLIYYLKIFYLVKSNYAYSILSKIPLGKLDNLNLKFVSKHHILSDKESALYKVFLVDGERYEPVRTPDVYDVAKNNFVNLKKHEIAIYCFPDARIREKSDIIKTRGDAFWEKANRPEFAQVLPVDSDFISLEKIERNVITFEEEKVMHYDIGFSLCGVHTNTWANFIISYLPKLIAI